MLKYFIASLFLILSSPLKAAPAELKMGRYVGFIQTEGSSTVIAAVADLYLFQPPDLKSFPRMQMTLRVGLGGLNSAEYVTETYSDIQYDFDNGNLTFDEAHKNIVIHALVEKRNQPTIVGDIWVKSSAVSGNIELKFLDDEPEDEPGDEKATDAPALKYFPTISGAYQGTCGSKESVLYIDASRVEFSEKPTEDVSTLTDYTVYGRLGYLDSKLCGLNRPGTPSAERDWCSIRQFTKVSFDAYAGKVLLEGSDGSSSCKLKDKKLTCTLRIAAADEVCILTRQDQPDISPQKYYSRKYYVSPTPTEKAELPLPSAPANADLVAALKGDFYGYLHHELTDRYQAARLKVLSSTSTDNPHNPNMAFISPHLSLYFGKTLDGTAILQDFTRRSFYIRPGFTLDAEDSDLFVQIEDWKMGYIRGVVMSRAFGRIGTIQLVKRPLAALPSDAKMIPDILGTFAGPQKSPTNTKPFWRMQLVGMSQNSDADDHMGTYSFRGDYQVVDSVIPRKPITNGSYDFLSLHVGLVAESSGEQPILISGSVQDDALQLFWPSAPVFGTRLPSTHTAEPYIRLSPFRLNGAE